MYEDDGINFSNPVDARALNVLTAARRHLGSVDKVHCNHDK
jgi:hypothetical protein